MVPCSVPSTPSTSLKFARSVDRTGQRGEQLPSMARSAPPTTTASCASRTCRPRILRSKARTRHANKPSTARPPDRPPNCSVTPSAPTWLPSSTNCAISSTSWPTMRRSTVSTCSAATSCRSPSTKLVRRQIDIQSEDGESRSTRPTSTSSTTLESKEPGQRCDHRLRSSAT